MGIVSGYSLLEFLGYANSGGLRSSQIVPAANVNIPFPYVGGCAVLNYNITTGVLSASSSNAVDIVVTHIFGWK